MFQKQSLRIFEGGVFNRTRCVLIQRSRYSYPGHEGTQAAGAGLLSWQEVDDGHVTEAVETVLDVVDFHEVSLFPANDKQLVIEYRHAVDGSVAALQHTDRLSNAYTNTVYNWNH